MGIKYQDRNIITFLFFLVSGNGYQVLRQQYHYTFIFYYSFFYLSAFPFTSTYLNFNVTIVIIASMIPMIQKRVTILAS